MGSRTLTRRDFLGGVSGALTGALVARRRASAQRSPPFDVCVVGSGFAGTFLGLRLLELGLRTVIVEAGGFLGASDLPEGAAQLLPIQDENDLGLRVDATRTVGVGGTSRRWSGVTTRLRADDFRTRSRFGLFVDWPVRAGDIRSYVALAEKRLGASRRVGDDRVERYRSPASLFPGQDLRFEPLSFSSRGGRRQALRLIDSEVPRFRASPLATLLTERIARRILTQDDRAVALEVALPNGTTERIEARCFVVAAGVPENARLLLASRSTRFPRGLGNEHDWVGRFLTVHRRHRVEVALPADLDPPPGIHRSWSPGPRLRRSGHGAAHLDLHLGPTTGLIELMVEMDPRANNRLQLGEDGISACCHYSESALDRDTDHAVRQLHERLMTSLARGERLAAPFDPAQAWFHLSGVCRMAKDAARGVVDRDCKVFGCQNVFVAGASVFPTAGSGNPTLTIVALALRLADHIGKRLGVKRRVAGVS